MPDEALQAATIGERTYRRIRADIVFGRLAPKERLTLDRMRDVYSASVSTRATFNAAPMLMLT